MRDIIMFKNNLNKELESVSERMFKHLLAVQFSSQYYFRNPGEFI